MNFFFKRLLFAVGGLVAAITMMAAEEPDVTRLTFLFKDGIYNRLLLNIL